MKGLLYAALETTPILHSVSAYSVINPLLFTCSPSLGSRELHTPAPLGGRELPAPCHPQRDLRLDCCPLSSSGTPSLGKLSYILSSKPPHMPEGWVLSRHQCRTWNANSFTIWEIHILWYRLLDLCTQSMQCFSCSPKAGMPQTMWRWFYRKTKPYSGIKTCEPRAKISPRLFLSLLPATLLWDSIFMAKL